MLGNARTDFLLDPAIAFCNHGSFGATPRPVLEAQQRWRARLEAEPVRFLDRELPGLIDHARGAVATFLRADPAGLAFVPNATTAINAMVRSLALEAGDEIVTTDHAYGAIRHLLERVAASSGSTLRIVSIGLPFPSDGEVVEAIERAVRARTRLVVIDEVASATGAVFPVGRIVESCRARGVACLVDGAHSPGMLDVNLDELAPDFWAGNLHKWVCAPKGAAVLWLAPQHRHRVQPPIVSHGYLTTLHERFDWQGTFDPTAWLSVPDALGFMDAYGWRAVRAHNDGLAERGRALVAGALKASRVVRDDAARAMTLVPIPDGFVTSAAEARAASHALYVESKIEVPFIPWGKRSFVRLSAQIYNVDEDYERLARALPAFVRR